MNLLGSSLKNEESQGQGEAEIKEASQQPQQPTPDLSSSDTTNTRLGNAPSSVTPAQQLTIFYAGSVSVFDAVPPEKAQAIMLLAAAAAAASASLNSKNNGQQQQQTQQSPMLNAPAAATAAAATAAASPALTRCLSFQSSSTVAGSGSPPPQLLANPASNLCKLQAELPSARRNSLQRFLEKRRDRHEPGNSYSVVKVEHPLKKAHVADIY